jgi:hypothetical protein
MERVLVSLQTSFVDIYISNDEVRIILSREECKI